MSYHHMVICQNICNICDLVSYVYVMMSCDIQSRFSWVLILVIFLFLKMLNFVGYWNLHHRMGKVLIPLLLFLKDLYVDVMKVSLAMVMSWYA